MANTQTAKPESSETRTTLDLEALKKHFGEWYRDDELLEEAEMNTDFYPYRELFSPIKIGRLEIKNRLVMAPMGNINMNDETGRPGERMVRYFEERAKGGTGLLTSGLVPVSQGIDPTVLEKDRLGYFPRLHGSRSFYSGWRDIANACHAYGARFFIQLTAGLGRVGNPECLLTLKRFPRSASFNKNYYLPAVPCLRLSDRSLKKIIRRTGDAAADAKVAGIDGVYLHAHEGYLMEQLANRAFNRRKLGRYANWQAFGIDMVKEIRRRCGDRYPIMFRLDLSLMLNVTYGEELKKIPELKKYSNERSVEESLQYMEALIRAGVDCFDVDLGCYDNWWLPHPPTFMPPACYRDVAACAKAYLEEKKILSNQGVPVPIVAVGKLGYPDLAEKLLREGKADMIMLGRPLLADPYWPQKAYAGRVADIRPCIGCQDACINEFVEGGHPYCTVNPRCSFEMQFPLEAPPAPRCKRVAVIGAGPAGIECALACHARGHEVVLFDDKAAAGGTLDVAALAKIKMDLHHYVDWLQHQVDKASQEPGFRYLPKTIASLNMLLDERFDVIVCATGAKAVGLPVDGAEHALLGAEVTEHLESVEGKKKIIIVGAGAVGMELAFKLSDDPEREILIVEATDKVLDGVCTANRGYLIYYLKERGAKIWLHSQLVSISDKGATIRHNVSPSVPNPFVTWTPLLPENVVNPLAKPVKEDFREEFVEADAVILAVGMKSDDKLYRELVQNYAAPEIYNIGDSFQAATIKPAVRAGYRLGMKI